MHEPAKRKPQGRKNRAALIGVVALVAIAIAAWLVLRDTQEGASSSIAPGKSRKIADNGFANAGTNMVVDTLSNAVLKERGINDAEAVPTNRVRKHSGRFIDISKAIIPPRKDPPRRFDHHAEEDIASLLEVVPGEVLVGSIDYHKKGLFMKSFRESLVSPTLTQQDDSAYMKDLKRAVTDVKADLRERMDRGEDIAQIMEDSRKELQELGCYRMELERELANVRKDSSTTIEDYEDFVKAANVLLEKKGAKPLKIPKVIYNQFKLRKQRISKK